MARPSTSRAEGTVLCCFALFEGEQTPEALAGDFEAACSCGWHANQHLTYCAQADNLSVITGSGARAVCASLGRPRTRNLIATSGELTERPAQLLLSDPGGLSGCRAWPVLV